METPPVINPNAPRPPGSLAWEYKTIKVPVGGVFAGGVLDTLAFDGVLNKLGSLGWELVAAFDTNQSQGASREAIAIFKRSVL
jgi:hypothetical protein